LSVDAIPEGEEWQYEPKWDDFRCLSFRDGNKIELQSKSQQRLARYCPELVRAFSGLKARRFVPDGEIAVPEGASFSFDALLPRIHPAASRVERLSAETPAIDIAFDLLADEHGTSLLELPLRERRRHLERFAEEFFSKGGRIYLSPATPSPAQTKDWLAKTSVTLDGIIVQGECLAPAQA
jgi:ATP-dependent DNA ligase